MCTACLTSGQANFPQMHIFLTGQWIECKQSPQGIDEHKLVTALLKMEFLNEDHTAANILHHLQAVVKQWQDDVGAKFSVEYFVTDNATNMVKAMADNMMVTMCTLDVWLTPYT